MPPKRSLFLHLSALSDAEYNVYVEALRDIVDEGDKPDISDDELENRKVSLPVVRAWMKGRFRDLGSAEIDKALHLFSPQMPQKEMSGGQLLAALRLLMHVRHGGELNEANVFVQAEPSSPTVSRHPTLSTHATSFELERPTTDAPALPDNPGSTRTNPFFASGPFQNTGVSNLAPPNYPSSDSPRRASLSSALEDPAVSSKPRIDGVGVPPGSTNPFLQRAKTHSGNYGPGPSGSVRTPPLPPRKPSHMSSSSVSARPPPIPLKPPVPSPFHAPTSSNSASSSSSSVKNAPPVPPHRVTPLMQQSLLASRVGASLKRAQEEAVRTRVLEVIRSSSDVSVPQTTGKERVRTQSSSRSPDKGARRPVPQPPRPMPAIPSARSDSGAPSEASLAEVASARLTSRSRMRTRTDSPGRISRDSSSSSDREEYSSTRSRQLSASEQFSPPPMHPARRPSVQSSGRSSRHIRSPSYQAYKFENSPAAGASSLNKSKSTSGVVDQNYPSSSPSPSPSPSTPTHPRPTRSQSMHQPSSPTLSGRLGEMGISPTSPVPPARRKRPESAQFSSRPRIQDLDRNAAADVDRTSPFANSFGVRHIDGVETNGGVVSSMAARFDKPGRRSAENDRDKDKDKELPNAFASLQRTFSALQQRAQPAITRARFKAEAGLLAPRRGFVPNGPEYHMAGEDGDRLVARNDYAHDEGGMDFSPVTDQDCDESASGEDTIRARGRSRYDNTRNRAVDRDSLKLPEEEGWTRL